MTMVGTQASCSTFVARLFEFQQFEVFVRVDRWRDDAKFGDNAAGDERRRRHVERRVPTVDA